MDTTKVIQDKLPSYTDERGTIQMMEEDCVSRAWARITSLAGISRALHWHKNDWHLTTVEIGQMEYYERPVGTNERPKKYLINAGDTFYTAPMVEHEMYFTQPTVFYCTFGMSRKSNDYELDTTRFSHSLRDLYNQMS